MSRTYGVWGVPLFEVAHAAPGEVLPFRNPMGNYSHDEHLPPRIRHLRRPDNLDLQSYIQQFSDYGTNFPGQRRNERHDHVVELLEHYPEAIGFKADVLSRKEVRLRSLDHLWPITAVDNVYLNGKLHLIGVITHRGAAERETDSLYRAAKYFWCNWGQDSVVHLVYDDKKRLYHQVLQRPRLESKYRNCFSEPFKN